MKFLTVVFFVFILVGCSVSTIEAQYNTGTHHSQVIRADIIDVGPIYDGRYHRESPYDRERCYSTPRSNLKRIRGYRQYRKGRLYCYRESSMYRRNTGYQVEYWNPVKNRIEVLRHHTVPRSILLNEQGYIIRVR